MALKTFIAGLGENPNFVAFNAHWGFAFFVITIAAHFHAPIWWVAGAAVALAGFKEYYEDKHFELAPPQSFKDNTLDFAGYLIGIGLGLWLALT